MATITKISVQKRASDRYNVFLDGKYSFPVSEKVLFSHGLKEGLELEQSAIDEVIQDENYEKIYNKVLNFLSYRIRSRREVEDRLKEYLYKGGVSETLSQDFKERILGTLDKLGLLDDSNFVQLYIENSKSLKNPPGQQKMRQFLFKKGVEKEIIEAGLATYTQEDEEKGALLSLEKKLRSIKGPVDYKEKQKIFQFLMRKGYSIDTVKRVVDSKFEV